MTVFLVVWEFTMEVVDDSVFATREDAEAYAWALGNVGFGVVEMRVRGSNRRASTGWPVAA